LRTSLGCNDMMAYLTMMAIRLVELHRALKKSGSIYLHCDPTASHYLKIVMDAIFGARNFRNEIIWCYRGGGRPKKDFGRKHDIILRYSKTQDLSFYPNSIRIPYQAEGIERKDESMWGRHKGTKKIYKPHPKGKVPEDWWLMDALNANSPERLGYPTQKPEVLLERIIKASSNEGDIVLDPFCGCGTTIAVAERLHRCWLGIDITHLAITLIRHRLHDTYGSKMAPYEVIGDPKDLESAKALARENRYQFEWWVLGLMDARPAHDKKKGSDTGVDGFIFFFDDESGTAKKIIVQVKSGKVSVSQIRDLKGSLEREKAVIAVFATLQESTREMLKEAAATGFYEPAHFPGKYPKLQILTIEELLSEKKVLYPRVAPSATFRKATPKSKGGNPEQGYLLKPV